jgi:hypothetical protein
VAVGIKSCTDVKFWRAKLIFMDHSYNTPSHPLGEIINSFDYVRARKSFDPQNEKALVASAGRCSTRRTVVAVVVEDTIDDIIK